MTQAVDTPALNGFISFLASQSVGTCGNMFGKPCERPSRSSLRDGFTASFSRRLVNRASMRINQGSGHATHCSSSNLDLSTSPSTGRFARHLAFAIDSFVAYAHIDIGGSLRSPHTHKPTTSHHITSLSNLIGLVVGVYPPFQKFLSEYVGFGSSPRCFLW